LDFIQQALESFHLFLLLQDDGYHNSLKRPWASNHYPSLDVQFGAIKESIEDGLIGFGQCFFERHLAAAFLFDEGAKRRERLTHGMILRRQER
jgi:hypothetical protein